MSFWRKTRPALDAHRPLVSIYTKPDCHLCEQAKARLLELKKQHGFRLEEVDITRDPSLFAEFETRIPLIWVNGRLVCKYVVDEEAIGASLSQALAPE